MNELHLFAGAGGGILGGMLLGHTTVCAVENNEYCQQVLLQRQRDGILPKFPIWDDVKTFDGTPWRGRVDVVCGGFPCQDISAAGKGKGITGERSGLWAEMARIVGEVQPSFVFVENSPMLTSRGLDVVLGDLSTLGYDARWGVLGAHHTGLPHKRERVWIFAYPIRVRRRGLDQSKQKGCPKLNLQNVKEKFRPYNLPFPVEQFNNKPLCGICRKDDGLATGVDRSKAIGNGQSAPVVKLAWGILKGE